MLTSEQFSFYIARCSVPTVYCTVLDFFLAAWQRRAFFRLQALTTTLSRRGLLAVDGRELLGRRRVGEPLVGPLADEAREAQ